MRRLHGSISEHDNSYPDAAFIILGDFNHCNLRKYIPKLYKSVTFPTRGNKTLDQCYSNIKNAFLAAPLPHFGKSDHLAIILRPAYIKRLKARPVTIKTVNTWTDECTGESAGLPGGHRLEHLQRCHRQHPRLHRDCERLHQLVHVYMCPPKICACVP